MEVTMAGYTPTRAFSQQQRDRMDRITSGLPTKAAKMRALEAAGVARADIAAYIGTTYQHVRGTLGPPAIAKALTEAEGVADQGLFGMVRVDDRGQVTLPAGLVLALGLRPGREVVWTRRGDTVEILGRKAGLRWAQDLVAERGGERSGTALLAEERREQSERERRLEQRSG
jgi:bifunctional DNA-binding transcriptional regulator/antitoxin component of YhaV-PrlF toxin-antitoxin module